MPRDGKKDQEVDPASKKSSCGPGAKSARTREERCMYSKRMEGMQEQITPTFISAKENMMMFHSSQVGFLPRANWGRNPKRMMPMTVKLTS